MRLENEDVKIRKSNIYIMFEFTVRVYGYGYTVMEQWSYISNKEREAHKTCFSEIKLSDPKLYNSIENRNYSMEDSIRFDRVIDDCMKKKGF